MEYDLSNIILFYLPTATDFAVYGNADIVWNDKNIPEPTKEQIETWKISYIKEMSLINCKKQAQALLSESDWADLVSVRSNLQNVSEWDNYRNEVRQLRTNPVQNPVFPTKPQVLWVQQDDVSGGNT